MFIEEFSNGDGYWHLCDSCKGSIGENSSLTIATMGEPAVTCEFHTSCFYV